MEISVIYTDDSYSKKSQPTKPCPSDAASGDNLRIRFRGYDVGCDLVFTKETLDKYRNESKSEWNSMKYSVETEIWKRDEDDKSLVDEDGEQIVTWSTVCVTDNPGYHNGQIPSLKVALVGPLLDLINNSSGLSTIRRCMRFADA